MRPTSGDAADVTGMRTLRVFRAKADIDGNSFFTQPFVTFPRHFGVGIFHRGNHARDPRARNGVGAGRSLSLVRAWLKRDVHRGALRSLFCATQGLDFGMRTATLLCPSTRQNNAVLHNDRTNSRIWPRVTEVAPAERQRQPHITLVICRCRLGNRCCLFVHLRALAAGLPSSSPDSSSSAARKSLASRKLR